MATPYHSQCSQFKQYRLFQCTFLTKCIQIRNISPFLIRPSVRTGAPSPRGKVLCSRHPHKFQFTALLSNVEKDIAKNTFKSFGCLNQPLSYGKLALFLKRARYGCVKTQILPEGKPYGFANSGENCPRKQKISDRGGNPGKNPKFTLVNGKKTGYSLTA